MIEQPNRPSQMSREDFVSAYGGIFEHSAWIAEQAFDEELGPANDTASGLHAALCFQFRGAGEAERMGVLEKRLKTILAGQQ